VQAHRGIERINTVSLLTERELEYVQAVITCVFWMVFFCHSPHKHSKILIDAFSKMRRKARRRRQ
jgi:hypothetical protein